MKKTLWQIIHKLMMVKLMNHSPMMVLMITLTPEVRKVSLIKLIISQNEVFGDIMVLASPPRPPVDPDDVNPLTRQIFNLSLSNFI